MSNDQNKHYRYMDLGLDALAGAPNAADYSKKLRDLTPGELVLELVSHDRRSPVGGALDEVEAALFCLSSAVTHPEDSWTDEILELTINALARKLKVVGEIHDRMAEAFLKRISELEEELAAARAGNSVTARRATPEVPGGASQREQIVEHPAFKRLGSNISGHVTELRSAIEEMSLAFEMVIPDLTEKKLQDREQARFDSARETALQESRRSFRCSKRCTTKLEGRGRCCRSCRARARWREDFGVGSVAPASRALSSSTKRAPRVRRSRSMT